MDDFEISTPVYLVDWNSGKRKNIFPEFHPSSGLLSGGWNHSSDQL